MSQCLPELRVNILALYYTFTKYFNKLLKYCSNKKGKSCKGLLGGHQAWKNWWVSRAWYSRRVLSAWKLLRTCCIYMALASYVFRVHSFGMIWIWINDPRSLGSWNIKGTNKSFSRSDSLVPLMHHDPSDLGSLIQIWIIPKEGTLIVWGRVSKGLR